MIKAVYLYKVNIFDITSALNRIKENKIKIYKLKKINQYEYTFYASRYKFKKIKEIFLNVEVIKQTGYASIFLSLFKYKTTIISLIISVFFYISLSNRIWIIKINGDAENLISFIQEQLTNNNINVGAKKLEVNEISNIQNKILYSNFDVIEYLSISSNGCSIDVSFKKKRKETTIDPLKGNLFAKRDGMIKSFDLLSGEKVVSINDYVKEGDLLVKDVLLTDYNEEIYIGTKGSVYAYTWYYITIDTPINANINEADLFSNLLLSSKEQICKNFTDNEYIYSENVLQFKKDRNNVYMKVHFTCVEDIVKE